MSSPTLNEKTELAEQLLQDGYDVVDFIKGEGAHTHSNLILKLAKEAAYTNFTMSLNLAEEAGDKETSARASLSLGELILRFTPPGYQSPNNLCENYCAEALRLFHEIGDELGEAAALRLQAEFDPDMKRRAELAQESLVICRRLNDRPGIARSLKLLATSANLKKDTPLTVQYLEEALSLFRELDDRVAAAAALVALSTHLEDTDREKRVELILEGRKLYGEAGCGREAVMALQMLAHRVYAPSDYDRRKSSLLESLEICRKCGYANFEAASLKLLSEIAGSEGDITRANALLAESRSVPPALLKTTVAGENMKKRHRQPLWIGNVLWLRDNKLTNVERGLTLKRNPT
jgi:hypothetical protein